MTFLGNGIRYKISVLHSTEDVDTNVHSNLNKNEWLQRENSRLEIKKALWKNCVLRNTIKIQKFVFHRTEYLKMITSYIWIFMRYSRFKVAFNRIIGNFIFITTNDIRFKPLNPNKCYSLSLQCNRYIYSI